MGLRAGWACLWLLGCASSPGLGSGGPDNYGYNPEGKVWVRGPWDEIRSSPNADEVIDQLCPAVMKLPRVQRREYGQEYCGAIYSLGDGIYYASHPSPLGSAVLINPTKRKMCRPPRYVEDPRGHVSVLADFHSHPWPYSRMSEEDMLEKNQLWSIRLQFDTTCRVMKLIPYLGVARPGEVYERRGGEWVLIGIIKPENKATGVVSPPGG
ncbi:hypothetical protein F0U60_49560 [Archangium minus]|uniref:JAB domain-containing protein n=2 Tax=Archangiaceae TaxID=39 RepID=A0ABY9X7B8_9BACT|nr:hypothetical protein F0U60_49560 [Archangium minus]